MEDFAAGGLLNLRGGLSKRAWRAGTNGNMSAFAHEFLRDGPAQAFAGCRDDGHAATKPQIHSTSQFKPAMLSQSTGKRQRLGGMNKLCGIGLVLLPDVSWIRPRVQDILR